MRDLVFIAEGQILSVADSESIQFYNTKLNMRLFFRFDCANAAKCTDLRFGFYHLVEIANLDLVVKNLNTFVSYEM